MNLEKLKDSARKYEQKEDWRRAIDVYLKAIHEFETGKDQHPDLSLYNRVGDLYMKVADTAAAVRSYERAADLYTEQGFLNNAIALCGKILRVNPSRTQIYFKLAQIHARKNMVVDAKRHLIEFLERMNRAGQLDEAFQSVKIFADQFSQNQEIRLMLIDLLRAASRNEEALEQLEKLATDLEARGDRVGARRTRERMEEIEAGHDAPAPLHTPAADGAAGLVFLDTGSALGTPPRVTPPPATVAPPHEPTPGLVPGGGLHFIDVGDEADSVVLQASPESLGLDVPPEPVAPSEAPSMLLGDIELTSMSTPLPEERIAPLEGFEAGEVTPPTEETPAGFDLMLEPAFETETIESRPLEGLELVQPADEETLEGRAGTPVPAGDDALVVEVTEGDAPPLEFLSLDEAPAEDDGEPAASGAFDELTPLEPVAAEAVEAVEAVEDVAAESPEVAFAEPVEPVAEEPEAFLAREAEAFEPVAEAAAFEPEPEPEPAPVAPSLDGLELIEPPAAASPAALSVAELEDRVLENPDDPATHRALAEALLVHGDTARAVEELELALAVYEQSDELSQADELLALLITLNPDAIRYYQKRVEHAYRRGDRDQLLGAYLDLGDVLARLQAVDKAAAVYGRVLEHEPANTRARLALQLIGVLEAETPVPVADEAEPEPDPEPVADAPAAAATPVVTPPPAPVPPPFVPRTQHEAPAEPVAPPAMPTPVPVPLPPRTPREAREPAVAAGADGFVDLGSLVFDPEGPRDTRMTGEQLEPTGDEDKDFREMLAQFRKGIEDNVALDDYEAHYDLGVAFKEMGLYDEAVAEFQKALRAPEGRLRTSEALGICFYEKGQVPVAEAVLRRAVEALPGGDEEKIGLIYWLGRACEAQGKGPEARRLYERALAVDIRFMDINERVNRLTTERQ